MEGNIMNNNIVLVRSYPAEPLIRKVFGENNEYVMVWRGDSSATDYPSPCPKNKVFEADLELKRQIDKAILTHGVNNSEVEILWQKARPVYNS